MYKFLKVDFLNYTACSDNVVFFSIIQNEWSTKSSFRHIFLFPIKQCRGILENLSERTTKKVTNYLIPFAKQNSLNRSGVKFPQYVFSELIDVAKY